MRSLGGEGEEVVGVWGCGGGLGGAGWGWGGGGLSVAHCGILGVQGAHCNA